MALLGLLPTPPPPGLSRFLEHCPSEGGRPPLPFLGPRPAPYPLPVRCSLPTPRQRQGSHPHPGGGGAEPWPRGKRKVSAAQSDAKILKELFGGGYLEIRPCEGRREYKYSRSGNRSRTGSRAPGASRARGPPCFPGPWTSLPTDSRQVGRLARLRIPAPAAPHPAGAPLGAGGRAGVCAWWVPGAAAPLEGSTGGDRGRLRGTGGHWRAPWSAARGGCSDGLGTRASPCKDVL